MPARPASRARADLSPHPAYPALLRCTQNGTATNSRSETAPIPGAAGRAANPGGSADAAVPAARAPCMGIARSDSRQNSVHDYRPWRGKVGQPLRPKILGNLTRECGIACPPSSTTRSSTLGVPSRDQIQRFVRQIDRRQCGRQPRAALGNQAVMSATRWGRGCRVAFMPGRGEIQRCRGRNSMARVPAFQAGCCGFESHRPLSSPHAALRLTRGAS
jgi:hypothetical protein